MSKAKTLPAVVSHHLYAQPTTIALGHEAGYKRAGPLSPPLAGTRGYPYPQDPTRTHFSPLLNSTQQSYRDAFQVGLIEWVLYEETEIVERGYCYKEKVQPLLLGWSHQIEIVLPASDRLASSPPPCRCFHYPSRGVGEGEGSHVRRRPSLLPTPSEYAAASAERAERERYLEAYRFPYEREMGLVGLQGQGASLEPMEVHMNKRPRLGMDPKAPLLIDTHDGGMVEVKKAARRRRCEAVPSPSRKNKT
ncbi:hypothetical protein HPB47_004178 [Ixodes persulcatus]|uniref:Uncharacterized protein n=1 Tax=Ixodes persulcatus TaxID=34615 RepID=A0AC60PHB3_IXOPE|nr:hypothetical protein HPB47_004178 [Ixodes persulcatus]